MPKNPVRWFEIYVQDMNRAKKFYESVFEVKLEGIGNPLTMNERLEMWAFPANADEWGCSGALVRMQGAPSGGLGTIVYFASDDCAVEEARVRQFSGKIQRGKTAIGEYGFITLAIDTEGNVFGIHSMK